MMGMADRVY